VNAIEVAFNGVYLLDLLGLNLVVCVNDEEENKGKQEGLCCQNTCESMSVVGFEKKTTGSSVFGSHH